MNNTNSIRSFGISALVTFFVASSCTSTDGLLTSLEEITSEIDRQGVTDVNQTRVMSLTGLLGPSSPGSIYRFKKNRAASTAIGLTPGKTHFIYNTVPPPTEKAVAQTDLDNLRDKMLELRESAALAVAEQLELAAARTAAAAAPSDTALAAVVTAKQTDVDTARTKFDAAVKDSMKRVKPGMLVFRWATNSNASGSIGLGSIFTGAASSSRKASGFAIAYGIRVSTLFVGEDISKVKLNQNRQWHWFESTFPWIIALVQDENVRITSHVLQAKHLIWFQDVSLGSRIAAHLEASSRQLGKLSETLSELDKIEIDIVLTSLRNLGNMGSMSGIQRKKSDPLIKDGMYMQPSLDNDQEWQTIYYVDTHLEDLRSLYN